jgi:hypothetical protein
MTFCVASNIFKIPYKNTQQLVFLRFVRLHAESVLCIRFSAIVNEVFEPELIDYVFRLNHKQNLALIVRIISFKMLFGVTQNQVYRMNDNAWTCCSPSGRMCCSRLI